MGKGDTISSELGTGTVFSQAARVLEESLTSLAERVSDRCFAELASYKPDVMPREESRKTVERLLVFLITHLRASSEPPGSAEAGRWHSDLVRFEEGIAARRVKMQIEFSDLMMGLHFLSAESWALLARELPRPLSSEDLFALERRLNGLIDQFFVELSSAYVKSAKEVIESQEQALQKWEEVVRSASEIRLKIPCENEFAAIVRLQAEALARRSGFSDEEIYDIMTAVGEVCDNAIEHGGSERGIDVIYRFAPTEISVEVQDFGRGFDPAGRGDEVPDLFSERGRGIFLMKHLMDRVEIDSRVGQGTRVLLAKSRD